MKSFHRCNAISGTRRFNFQQYTSKIISLIVSITKFSILIGSARVYIKCNRNKLKNFNFQFEQL